MLKLLASAAALVIFVSAAAAQNPSPQPPPAADQARPGNEGPPGRPHPPGPPPGAHVRVDFGRGKNIDVKCNDREPFKVCLDGAMAVLDKVMPEMRAASPLPPDRGRGREWDRDRERMPMQEERLSMMAPDTRGYLRSMHDMMRDMGDSDFTGDPSHDFATIMIPYNKGAVAMAESLLKNENADPEMRMMARKMLQEQADNAAQLEDWLNTRQR